MTVTAEDVHSYISGKTFPNPWPDTDAGRQLRKEIEQALQAEQAAQWRTLNPYYLDSLDVEEALRRRVACNLARRALPLGVQMTDVGGTRISTHDPEIRRLEAPYRKTWAVG